MTFPVIVIVLSMLVCSVLTQPYELKFQEVDILNRNSLELECFSSMVGRGIDGAIFWLDGVSLAESVTVHPVSGSSNIQFIINRSLEGNYTCGIQTDRVNRVQSAPKTLVAYPTPVDVDPSTLNHRDASSREARLPCSIQPGKLVDFYKVEWSMAGRGQLVVFQWGMAQINVNHDKYRVDRSDLSLVITDVSPADAGAYVCVLGVDGADRADDIMYYEQSSSFNITLMVFDPPSILEPPMPQVAHLPENTFSSMSNDSVMFYCTASAASTSLSIVWLHEGRDVSRLDSNKYSFSSDINSTNDGTITVSSQLVIMNVGVNDNGNVTCEAQIPTSDGIGDYPVTASKTTTLSVLSGFRRVKTSITHEGLVLFDIEMYDIIQTEVRLLVEYTPTNGRPSVERITEEGFVRNPDILHLERNPPIRDTGFTVRVALITPNFEIQGPFSDPSQTLDVNQAPLSTEALTSITIAVPVTVAVVLIFIILVLVVVFVTKHKKRTHDLRGAIQAAQDLTQGRNRDHRSLKEEAEEFSEVVRIIYRSFKQCDGDGERDPQEQTFTRDEIEEAVEQIDNIVRAGIQHKQVQEAIIEKLKQWINIVQKEDREFLLTTVKACPAYKSAVYADSQTLCLSSENDQETRGAFAKFLKESLICLLRKSPDMTEQFKGIIHSLGSPHP